MEILREIRESDTLRKLWEKYRREYDYAKDISFEDTCNTVSENYESNYIVSERLQGVEPHSNGKKNVYDYCYNNRNAE